VFDAPFFWCATVKDQLENYVKKVKELQELCRGNEATTKAGLIAPLFGILGFDMADPRECLPEYRADFGQGEKAATPVDWAFRLKDVFVFVVEAKAAGKKLKPYAEQLGMYFAKVGARLGIYTNGVQWQFYADVAKANLMDKEPFLIWDTRRDDPLPLDFLTILHKSRFQVELIRAFAVRGRRKNLLVEALNRLLEPSPDFIRLAVKEFETRPVTANVIEEWRPILVNAIEEWAKQKTLSGAMHPPTASDDLPPRGDKRGGVKKASKDAGPKLADLVSAGLLSPQTNVFRKYKGKMFEATILADGGIEFDGTRFDSPSAAAEVARSKVTGRRMNTNGWTFWQYRDANGQKKELDGARQAFRAVKGGK
jgi:hypothetical protein